MTLDAFIRLAIVESFVMAARAPGNSHIHQSSTVQFSVTENKFIVIPFLVNAEFVLELQCRKMVLWDLESDIPRFDSQILFLLPL